MRRAVALALLLLLSSALVPVSASNWKFDPSLVHFYMYGMKTCPHCRHMRELIPLTYGADKFTYYELVGNKHNDEVMNNISRLIGVTGVPVIGIVYNGSLVAVIEGEYNVSVTPQIVRDAIKHNGTLLLLASGNYILPHNDTKAMKIVEKLQYLFTKAGEPEETPTTTSKENKKVCGPALIIAIAMVPLFLRRRR
ncbi:CGP-CTERM sorting domain-containing protein [Thermococcus sp. AM4]|uniref:CGP-CTERM sorting domain-containing protein n=1 Tax=Thermococcus sp. (strain AM4) TaxID=246969 RepID=UPI000187095D|nr:CGP-CTERM sorting domain-containing protein [Thermococcus sp. AM4]EEB74387.1 glutaredoxin-related protein [Thermococcus sp. AM4]